MRFTVAVVLLLAGCASAGVKVDPAKLAAFQQGKTTYPEVIAALGPPSAEAMVSTGERIVTYAHVETSVRAETFIPYIGPFVGGADSRSSTVSLQFNRDGLLEKYTTSAGQTGVGMGLSAGQGEGNRVAQPR